MVLIPAFAFIHIYLIFSCQNLKNLFLQIVLTHFFVFLGLILDDFEHSPVIFVAVNLISQQSNNGGVTG